MKLHSIAVRGHTFGFDLPPVVAIALERYLRPECVRVLSDHPWGQERLFMVPLVAGGEAEVLKNLAAAEAMRMVSFIARGPSILSSIDFLVEPSEADRPIIASFARSLLTEQLNDLEAWQQC